MISLQSRQPPEAGAPPKPGAVKEADGRLLGSGAAGGPSGTFLPKLPSRGVAGQQLAEARAGPGPGSSSAAAGMLPGAPRVGLSRNPPGPAPALAAPAGLLRPASGRPRTAAGENAQLPGRALLRAAGLAGGAPGPPALRPSTSFSRLAAALKPARSFSLLRPSGAAAGAPQPGSPARPPPRLGASLPADPRAAAAAAAAGPDAPPALLSGSPKPAGKAAPLLPLRDLPRISPAPGALPIRPAISSPPSQRAAQGALAAAARRPTPPAAPAAPGGPAEAPDAAAAAPGRPSAAPRSSLRLAAPAPPAGAPRGALQPMPPAAAPGSAGAAGQRGGSGSAQGRAGAGAGSAAAAALKSSRAMAVAGAPAAESGGQASAQQPQAGTAPHEAPAPVQAPKPPAGAGSATPPAGQKAPPGKKRASDPRLRAGGDAPLAPSPLGGASSRDGGPAASPSGTASPRVSRPRKASGGVPRQQSSGAFTAPGSRPASASSSASAATPLSSSRSVARRRPGSPGGSLAESPGPPSASPTPVALAPRSSQLRSSFSFAAHTPVRKPSSTLSAAQLLLPPASARIPEAPFASDAKQGRPHAATGLANLGNTCFMNSIVQCLSHTPYLTNILAQKRPPLRAQRIAPSFAALLLELESADGQPVAPHDFLQAVKEHDCLARFATGQQQDAQEFLRALVDGLHDDLDVVVEKPKYKEDKDDPEETEAAKADRLWSSYHAFSCSSIDTLFAGQLQSVITCGACNSRHSAYDPFWDLSLPLPPPSRSGGVGQFVRMALGRSQTRCDLPACLRLLCEDENLEKEDGFFCATCKQRQKAVKHLRIYRCPKILVLHLKRFSWQSGLSQQKLTLPVGIPSEISLKPVMSSDAPGEPPAYRLFGVVNHTGTIFGGHYTALALNSGDGQWWSYNDRAVKMEPGGAPAVSEAAYIAFYHAVEAKAPQADAPAAPAGAG